MSMDKFAVDDAGRVIKLQQAVNSTPQQPPHGRLLSSLVRWTAFFLVTIPIVLTAALSLLIPGIPGARIAHRLQLAWARIIVVLFGIRLDVRGAERIVRGRPAIYFFNHQSFVDTMIVASVLRVQYRYLVKAELFDVPVLGWGMRRTGYIPVARGSGRDSLDSFFRAAERVRGGHSLVIFPEATFAEDGRMLPFKRGGFVIASRAGVTVQPLTISGAYRVMPDQSEARVSRITPGPVSVHVHDPIEAETYGDWTPDEFKERVREVIARPLRADGIS